MYHRQEFKPGDRIMIFGRKKEKSARTGTYIRQFGSNGIFGLYSIDGVPFRVFKEDMENVAHLNDLQPL